ncbi:MAG TPA: hypothetical protein VGM03_17930 [Phycisphaerae bacterium]|jgi:hypothetical protein
MTKKMLKVGTLAALAGATVFGGGGCPFRKILNPRYLLASAIPYTALEFLTDNDSVFDLFQDDFGTGANFDDRFVPGASRTEPANAVAGTFNQ